MPAPLRAKFSSLGTPDNVSITTPLPTEVCYVAATARIVSYASPCSLLKHQPCNAHTACRRQNRYAVNDSHSCNGFDGRNAVLATMLAIQLHRWAAGSHPRLEDCRPRDSNDGLVEVFPEHHVKSVIGWLNTYSKQSCCKEPGQASPVTGWLEPSPNDSLRREAGHTTPALLLLLLLACMHPTVCVFRRTRTRKGASQLQ